ncbi:hypothetical protein [Sphingobacterium endophyticum]|uniref:hypothetical protein n=1 Tax=Sphingobacterium endophyticum TaxID=2546448 RepID=UPI0012E282A0|nr:hypothetical protein [Sphingobacterium endophyticum]
MIVINGGLKDGIEENTRLLVYSLGKEIVDPDTGVSLGALEVPKGYFKVTHSQDNMATLVAEIKTTRTHFPSVWTEALSKLDIETTLKNSIEPGDFVKIVNKL